MKFFLKILFVLFIIITIYVVRDDLATIFNRLSSFIYPTTEKSTSIAPLNEATTPSPYIPKKAYTPGPLTVGKAVNLGSVGSTEELLAQKIIELTNKERIANGGFAVLKENELLDRSASMKVDDMFQKQYFAHISPSGKGVSDVALSVGYDYIIIGENLASGDFINNKQLVDAWMASPGHRANILNPKYSDIGVGVKKGIYNGREVWMAVQHFGKPLSACPAIDSVLNDRIIENKKILDSQSLQLEALKLDIGNISNNSPKYAQEIENYNTLVQTYNTLLNLTKGLIGDYNRSVSAFNTCI